MRSVFKHVIDEYKYNEYYDKTLELFGLPYESINISTSFGKTHILKFGDAKHPPLLLLHGMAMSSTMWYPNTKHFIEHYCVYAIDISGDYGKSKVKHIINNKQKAADWLLEVIQGLSLSSCHIAGHSIGGFLAINFTLIHGQFVNKLVLLAPAGIFRPIKIKFFFMFLPVIVFHSRYLTKRALQWISVNYFSLDARFIEQLIFAYTSAMPLLHIIPSTYNEELYRAYTIPTLLLIGDKEVLYSPIKAIEKARKLIPNLKSYIISNANHTFTIEQADVVNNHILNFLKEG